MMLAISWLDKLTPIWIEKVSLTGYFVVPKIRLSVLIIRIFWQYNLKGG